MNATCACCDRPGVCKIDTDLNTGELTPICMECEHKGIVYISTHQTITGRFASQPERQDVTFIGMDYGRGDSHFITHNFGEIEERLLHKVLSNDAPKRGDQ